VLNGKAWRAVWRFWEHDPGLSVILVLLVLLGFVLPPEAGALIDLTLALLLLAGVAGLRVHSAVRALLLLVAVAAMVVRWSSGHTAMAVALSTLVSLGLLAVVVVTKAFRAGPVTIHRIQGAVAAYLLFGLTWAAAYQLIAALVPGAFTSAQALSAADHRVWTYFSFVTLTTVGYGDVTPVHQAARSLALLEALTGQLYPAILLARLVSLQTQDGGTPPSRAV
jgi:ion channel